MEDLENRLNKLERIIFNFSELENQLYQEQNEIAVRIGSIEKELSELKTRQNLQADPEIRITSIENELAKLKLKMGVYDKVIKENSDVELKEIVKKEMKYLEKNLENQATKVFSSNLQDFTKSLEKEFPRLVKQEQYYKDVHNIEEKIKKIKAPDFTRLENRIQMLEKSLSEIRSLIKNVSTRFPYVVE